jgi:outer membrane immunogenic protein
VVANYTTQIDWFGTVRARIGYVWGNGQVMSYLTGGLAYGEVKINGTNNVSATVANGGGRFLLSATQTFGHSQVNTGWVAGYGTEGRLGNSNWTWKVEGLYMGLGTLDTTSVTSGVSCTPVCTGLTGGQVATHTRFTDGILRGGLNYKFY